MQFDPSVLFAPHTVTGQTVRSPIATTAASAASDVWIPKSIRPALSAFVQLLRGGLLFGGSRRAEEEGTANVTHIFDFLQSCYWPGVRAYSVWRRKKKVAEIPGRQRERVRFPHLPQLQEVETGRAAALTVTVTELTRGTQRKHFTGSTGKEDRSKLMP